MIDLKYFDIGTPEGWELSYGDTNLMDPEGMDLDDMSMFDMTEDMLQLSRGSTVIDVGWYPDGALEGKYVVQVIRDNGWSDPVELFASRRPEEVAKFVERVATKYSGS